MERRNHIETDDDGQDEPNRYADIGEGLSLTTSGELRSECVTDEGDSLTWKQATDAFCYRQTVAQNEDSLIAGDTTGSLIPYSRGYDRVRQRQVAQLGEAFREKHRVQYITEFTLSGSPFDGSWQSPVEYLSALTESWDSVRQKIYDRFGDKEYCYFTALDPTKAGYPNLRVIVLSDGSISDSESASIVQAHVNNSPVADSAMNDPAKCITSTRSADLGDLIDSGLNAFGENRTDTWQTEGFLSLLWATGQSRFTFGSNAADLVSESPPSIECDMQEVRQ